MGNKISILNTVKCHECRKDFLIDFGDEVLCTGCKGHICKECNKRNIRCDVCKDLYCKFCRKFLILNRCKDCKVFKCKDCVSIRVCCNQRMSRIEEIKRSHMLFELEKRSGLIM